MSTVRGNRARASPAALESFHRRLFAEPVQVHTLACAHVRAHASTDTQAVAHVHTHAFAHAHAELAHALAHGFAEAHALAEIHAHAEIQAETVVGKHSAIHAVGVPSPATFHGLALALALAIIHVHELWRHAMRSVGGHDGILAKLPVILWVALLVDDLLREAPFLKKAIEELRRVVGRQEGARVPSREVRQLVDRLRHPHRDEGLH
mmetsp:Transcript_56061/g.156186  ORF Transcript_56061/g.156186 Transcript_56061/m.156186 type:complete len:207 (+) Transcript_56061:124-744(+)